jgi:diguanylate cyclase (GGDEF)-like protein
VVPGSAAEVPSDPGWTTFRTFGGAQGLPQNTVFALAQDRDGFVYAGTDVGLARYDGRRWQRVPLGLAAETQVTRLVATDDGALWVGNLDAGLIRIAGGRVTVMRGSDGAALDTAQALLRAGPDEVWAGTAGRLYRCSGSSTMNRCREVAAARGLLVSALALGEGPRGPALWVGTAYEGVRRLDLPAQGEPLLAEWRLGSEEGLPDPLIRSLAHWQGSLWIGSGRGVSRLAGDRLVVYSEAIGFARQGVYAFEPSRAEDGAPCLWAAQLGGGLTRFDAAGRWWRLTSRQGLPEDHVYSLLVSGLDGPTPILWAGSRSSGVLREERGRWRAWTERAGLPHRVVVGLGEVDVPGAGSTLWAGTLTGPARWDGGRWVPWLPELLGERVVRGAERVGEVLWVATDRGLLRWDGRRATLLTSDETALPGLVITDLEPRRAAGGEVEVWASTNHGLARIDRRGVVPFAVGQPFEGPRALLTGGALADGSQQLWLAAANGIFRYDGAAWRPFPVSCRLGGELYHLLWMPASAEAPASLWAAHRGGVTRVLADGSACRTFGREDGVDGPIFQLALDRQGELYLFGHDGVARMPVGAAGAARPPLERFGLQDGLPDLEFERAAFTDRRGRVWAASVGGIAAFDPAERPVTTPPPPLRLVRAVRRDGEPLLPGQTLAHRLADASFEYVLPAYGREERIRYRTQLVGLDPAPSPWRAESSVSYSRLPPGSYRFEVQARDANGRLAAPVSLAFAVGAPWWRTEWATGLAALALLGAGLGLGRARGRALTRRAAQLEQLVAERTGQLAEANRRLEEAALTDPLTGARNRRYLEARLAGDAAHARRRVGRGERDGHLAIVVVDLDRFKGINDRYGHAVGDEVLREVAGRLSGLVRLEDYLVRWGGEEFLMVLRDVDGDALPGIARRLLHVVAAQPVRTAAGELAVTCSAGLVPYPRNGDGARIEPALERADRALYEAKQSGRDRAVVVLPDGGPESVLTVLP